jgi:hypothetical protein
VKAVAEVEAVVEARVEEEDAAGTVVVVDAAVVDPAAAVAEAGTSRRHSFLICEANGREST